MKLGPAGEAFFVERTKEFSRREGHLSQGDSFLPGGGMEEALSPRDDTEEPVTPIPQDVAILPIPMRPSKDNLPSIPIVIGADMTSEPVPAVDAKCRHRSWSDGDAHPHLSISFTHPTARPGGALGSLEEAEISADGAAPYGRRRARAASDMSELTSGAYRAVQKAKAAEKLGTITAHSSAGSLGELDAEAQGLAGDAGSGPKVPAVTPDPASEAPPSATLLLADSTTAGVGEEEVAAPEDAAGPWMWRWGTLPKKKRAKGSSGDLQGQQHALRHREPLSDNVLEEKMGEAAGSSGQHKDARGRAVSLPLMFQGMADDGSGTAQAGHERQRHRARDRHALVQKVTSIERDIPVEESWAAEVMAMFECASADTSAFRALSLCGQLLEGVTAPEALKEVVAAHLVSPNHIVQGDVLHSPGLVVLLGDYLLPWALAERVVSGLSRHIGEEDASGEVLGEEVARALEEEHCTGLPAWAGQRMSQGASGDRIQWRECCSDLLQARRVHDISLLHRHGGSSSSDSGARESFADSPLLQSLPALEGCRAISYRELWRQQSGRNARGSPFTALLSLGTEEVNSLYVKQTDVPVHTEVSEDGYGVGYSFHPEHMSEASDSHGSLPMLISLDRAGQPDHDASHEHEHEVPSPLPLHLPMPSVSPLPAGASYMRDAPFRSLEGQRSGLPMDPVAEEGGSSQPSLCEDGDTDNDNLSLQDIDLEDISPEPAGGDFYDSDTDSYLSLSLEDGDTGSAAGARNLAGAPGGLSGRGQGQAGEAGGMQRRRFRRYRYRKVLVPSQEQLELLELQDGPNEISFELEGCAPLKSTLFVWPADAKVVVTDLEGVFCRSQRTQSSGVWISLLGGGSYYSSTSSKTEFDSCIRLFAGMHKQGYRVIYLAQGAQSSGSSGPGLLSSQDYLASIKASTGESLPAGPVFKSPDSLVRAFGAARTEVFKASALRGVKSLFSATHNPYHACFCTRDADAVPFSRFGFPEGRIFLVSDKGEIRSANRTCVLSFPALHDLLFQIFPEVSDSQRGIFLGNNEPDKKKEKEKEGTATSTALSPRSSISSAPLPSPGPGVSSEQNISPAKSLGADPGTARKVRCTSTDDAYSDFNFWKIPPAIIEDDF